VKKEVTCKLLKQGRSRKQNPVGWPPTKSLSTALEGIMTGRIFIMLL